jgi:hypothetical protein
VTLGKDSTHPPLADLAIGSFAFAAALLLYALGFTAIAVGYSGTPAQYLDYYPEAASKGAILAKVREQQWEEAKLRRAYSSRAAVCYGLGMVSFLLGLAFTLVPQHPWPWPFGRIVALAVVWVAILFEVIAVLSNASRPKWLLPVSGVGDVPMNRDPLEDEGQSLLFIARTDTKALTEETKTLTEELRRLGALLAQISSDSKPKGLRRMARKHRSDGGTSGRSP